MLFKHMSLTLQRIAFYKIAKGPSNNLALAKNSSNSQDLDLYLSKEVSTKDSQRYFSAVEYIYALSPMPSIIVGPVILLFSLIVSFFPLQSDFRATYFSGHLLLFVAVFITCLSWYMSGVVGKLQMLYKVKKAHQQGVDITYKPTWFSRPSGVWAYLPFTLALLLIPL